MNTALSVAQLRKVSKRYGNTQALTDLDLDIRAGELMALLGPNGAGKTTALGVLTGRLTADTGSAHVFGHIPGSMAARKQLGVMLQNTTLPDTARVDELLQLFASYYDAPMSVAEALDTAGLSMVAKRAYSALSGGQQRLVQFALALIGRPKLMLVDEPSTGLDVEVRARLWQTLRTMKARGIALVLTTHYLEEAEALADRVVVIKQGQLIADASPAELKQRLLGKWVSAVSSVSIATLQSWSECISARSEGNKLLVHTRQPEALLQRWFALDPQLSELEVNAQRFEDAIVSLTSSTFVQR
jgi:ABC-2 type transport system ATP-binding protein